MCCYEFTAVLYHFLLGCTLTDLTPTDVVGVCADRGFANTLPISNGVVCFSRTTAGSEVVYVCDDGFHQDGVATRVCQSDGVWNGSIPQCISDGRSTLLNHHHYYYTDIIM